MTILSIPFFQKNTAIHLTTKENNELKPHYLMKLTERLEFIQNTIMEFNLNGKSLTTDTRELSKNLLDTICKINTPIIKESMSSDSNYLSQAEKKLNTDIKEWHRQERITLPSAFINRTIDRTCKENHLKISENAKNEIFRDINEKYFPKVKLDPSCAQDSIIQTIINDKKLEGEISTLEINNIIPDDLNNIMSVKMDSINNSKHRYPVDIEEKQNKQKELSEFIHQYKASLTDKRMEIRADIHNYLAENMHNTLLCDYYYGANSGIVDFDTIRDVIRTMTLTKATPTNDTLRFYFPDYHLSVTTRQPDNIESN